MDNTDPTTIRLVPSFGGLAVIQSSLAGPTTLDDQLLQFLFNFSETKISPLLQGFSGSPVMQDISLSPLSGRSPGFLIDVRGSIEGNPFGGNFLLTLQGGRVLSIGIIALEEVFDQHKVELDILLESVELVRAPVGDSVDTTAGVEQLLDSIDEWVVLNRGLPAATEVQRRFQTRQEFKEENEQPDLESQLDTVQLKDLCVVLDLCSPDDDLLQIFQGLVGEAVLGYYQPGENALTLVTDDGEVDRLAWLTYAHEYLHALQDQNFGIPTPEEDTFEMSKALLALTEGDARLTEYLFYDSLPTDSQTLITEELARLIAEFSSSPVVQGIPRIIRETFGWEYAAGRDFLYRLYVEGGFPAVDAVYEDPPQSTEHILHLEKYLEGDQPRSVELPDLSVALGDGWFLQDSGVMGELLTRVYLGTFLPQQQAVTAAEGWGGDRYSLWKDNEGNLLMAMLFEWDTTGDSEEFFQSYVDVARNKGDDSWDLVQNGEGLRLWVGEGISVYLGLEGDSTLVVIGPDRGIVESVLGELPAFTPQG